MDIKDYIASGVIENYVLGLASEQEAKALVCLAKIYPEIAEELLKTQESLEKLAEMGKLTPPDELKSKVMTAVRQTQQNTVLRKVDDVIAVRVGMKPSYSSFYLWSGIAASLIFFILVGLYLNERRGAQLLKHELMAVKDASAREISETLDSVKQLNLEMIRLAAFESFVNRKSTRTIPLEGSDHKPDAYAFVYWDAASQEMVLAASGLPTPAVGKQFQLWAIVSGEPKSLGMLEKSESISGMISVDFENIQAFAITLEDDGGKDTPTLEELHVIGFI
jgi:anti-sigma-K factor RskA